MKTHIALSADSHTQSTMAEHFYAYQFSLRTTNILFQYLAIYLSHLVHIELACQYHNIGKLSIKLQSLDVRDVELSREVHFYILLSAICHHSHIRSDNCRNTCLGSSIHNLAHSLKVFTINDGVYGEICLYAMLVACGSNLFKVVDGEMVCRVRTHV